MKINRSAWVAFGLLVLVSSLYRVWDGRPFGFTPQIAMAIFGGAVMANKRLGILLPLISMLFSDVLYQLLYLNGLSDIQGFYSGQWINYLLIAGVALLGTRMQQTNVRNVLGYSISGSVLFFLASNFTVWLGGGGYHHPKTLGGLMLTYGDGLAFFRDYGLIPGSYANLLAGDLFFSALLFGAFALLAQKNRQLA